MELVGAFLEVKVNGKVMEFGLESELRLDVGAGSCSKDEPVPDFLRLLGDAMVGPGDADCLVKGVDGASSSSPPSSSWLCINGENCVV